MGSFYKHYLALALGVFFLLALFFVLEDHYLRMMIFIALFVLTLTGHMIFYGYAGQILLCHAAFMAIGGYTTAILCTRFNFSPFVGVILGVILATFTAYLIGKIILKLKMSYLAIATLSISIIVDRVLECWIDVTGGQTGILGIPPFSIGTFVLDDLKS
jgi:branched-chain amino acid transport system permease protein